MTKRKAASAARRGGILPVCGACKEKIDAPSGGWRGEAASPVLPAELLFAPPQCEQETGPAEFGESAALPRAMESGLPPVEEVPSLASRAAAVVAEFAAAAASGSVAEELTSAAAAALRSADRAAFHCTDSKPLLPLLQSALQRCRRDFRSCCRVAFQQQVLHQKQLAAAASKGEGDFFVASEASSAASSVLRTALAQYCRHSREVLLKLLLLHVQWPSLQTQVEELLQETQQLRRRRQNVREDILLVRRARLP